jgi:hypothetical protein
LNVNPLAGAEFYSPSGKSFISKGGSSAMDLSRKFGILVFFAVPAIIGGGIVFGLSDSWMYVFIYEILLLLVAGGFVAK